MVHMNGKSDVLCLVCGIPPGWPVCPSAPLGPTSGAEEKTDDQKASKQAGDAHSFSISFNTTVFDILYKYTVYGVFYEYMHACCLCTVNCQNSKQACR